MFAGSISPKAAKKLNGKLTQLRKTRPQKSKMAPFDAKEKDEKGTAGTVKAGEINTPATQAGGRPSKSGGIGKPESQVHANEINAPRNAKAFPAGGKASGRPGGTPSAAKGAIAPSGPMYGGGGRNTQ